MAGRRILVTIAQHARTGDTRPLGDDLMFEDTLALAAHLAALDADIVLAPVGEAFTPELREQERRILAEAEKLKKS